MSQSRKLLTIGEIARRASTERHKVDYAVSALAIEPAERAGQLRVFTESDYVRIREFLERRHPAPRQGK